MIQFDWSSLEGAVIVSLGKWTSAFGLMVAMTGTATAGDFGISVGVGGPRSGFGFSYNQPGWGGRPYHRHGGWGNHYSVGVYAAPRYYPAPRYIYSPTVVVPAPTYVVQPPPVVYQQVAPAPYPSAPPAQYQSSPPIQVPATPGRVPPPPPQPPAYSPNGY